MRFRKFSWAVLYCCFVSGVLVLLSYIMFRNYLKSLPSLEQHNPTFRELSSVPPETLARLGYVTVDKHSSFCNFPEQKRPGVIRVGCFGDSYTYGAEVGEFTDYPQLLQNLFRSEGYPQVEVLNFGALAYGFAQTYLLWEAVGTQYELDYILFGPKGFQADRLNTFSYYENFNPAHSRYIIQGSDVQLLDPVGANPRERVAEQRRFIPYWRYLRYDRRTPPFLKALLPRGRDFKRNPFYYYSGDEEEEARKIHEILITKILAAGPRLIVSSWDKLLLDRIQKVGGSKLRTVYFWDTTFTGFPYRAPGHYGPNGNQILAQMMFAALTNQSAVNVPLIKSSSVLSGQPRALQLPDGSCDLGFAIDGVILGRFTSFDKHGCPGNVLWRLDQLPAQTLLAFTSVDAGLFDAVWLPLDAGCSGEANIILTVETDSDQKNYQLTRAVPVGSTGMLWAVAFTNEPVEFDGLSVWVRQHVRGNDQQLALDINCKSKIKAATLRWDNDVFAVSQSIKQSVYDPLFSLTFDYQIDFEPSGREYLKITADPHGLIDPLTLAGTGVIDLHITGTHVSSSESASESAAITALDFLKLSLQPYCSESASLILRLDYETTTESYTLNRLESIGSDSRMHVAAFTGDKDFIEDRLELYVEFHRNIPQLAINISTPYNQIHGATLFCGDNQIAKAQAMMRYIDDPYYNRKFEYKFTFELGNSLPDGGSDSLENRELPPIDSDTGIAGFPSPVGKIIDPIVSWEQTQVRIPLTEVLFDEPIIRPESPEQ